MHLGMVSVDQYLLNGIAVVGFSLALLLHISDTVMESSNKKIACAHSAGNDPPYYLLRAFTSYIRSGYQREVNGSSEMFNLPTIIVENKVDAEAIPPALHTYYEGMMTCQGVPDVIMPEVCCDCPGASCARNPACLCKQHQASYGSDIGLKGFIYTKEG